MPHIPSTGVEAGPSSQILDHRPEIRAASDALLGPGSTLPVSLKENVRRALATDLGCRYCASFGAPPTEPADIQIGSSILGAVLGLEPSTEAERRDDEAMLAERAVARA